MNAREEDNAYLALRKFLWQFAQPTLVDIDHVLIGYNNMLSLPSDGNDFCIVTVLSENRRGQTMQSFAPSAQNAIAYRTYYEQMVQVDCYSSDIYNARYRAEAYETIARTETGVDFFDGLGFDLLYADGLQDMTAVLDSNQYVSRWTLNLYLGLWKQVTIEQQYFDTATVDLKNVDVAFPPSKDED